MFSGCTNLTKAPELLPAITLANYCYSHMFNNCFSLTEAPELPATTLAAYCYQYMFNKCTKLTSLKVGFAAWHANATNSWVQNVSSTGTFVKHPDMTSLPTGTSGIPRNWTVEDAVL
jgi:hypothetical protein